MSKIEFLATAIVAVIAAIALGTATVMLITLGMIKLVTFLLF